MSGGDTVAVTDDRWPSVGLVEHMIEVGRHPETAGQRIWPCWQVADALEAHSARHRLATQADALAVMREALDLALLKGMDATSAPIAWLEGYCAAATISKETLRAYLAREGGV